MPKVPAEKGQIYLLKNDVRRYFSFLEKLGFEQTTTISVFRDVLTFLEKRFPHDSISQESEEIVEEIPNCPLIPALIKKGKHKGEVYCPNPDIAGLKSGNFLPLEACQCCWWRRENFRVLDGTPNDETLFAPEKDSKEAEPKKPTSKKKPQPSMNCKNPYCDNRLVRKSTTNLPITEFCGEHRLAISNFFPPLNFAQEFIIGLLRGTISPIRSSEARNEEEHMEGIHDGTIPAIIDPSEQRLCLDCGCIINNTPDFWKRCKSCYWPWKEKQTKNE